MPVKIAIIGGSGLNNPELISNRQEKEVPETPYGKPSDNLVSGQIGGVDCVLLCRHGRHHTISPTNVNYRANIWALKNEGCTHIIATTACGSLQEDIHPGDFVLLDQFIDRTTKRQSTFYDGGATSPKGICHIPMHQPFCEQTRKILAECCKILGLRCHKSGTNITIEGSRFSTRAESRLFKSWGAHVINMTTVPEVVLAKEMGISYAAVALVTDYDCWRETGETVSQGGVLATLRQNSKNMTSLLFEAIPKIAVADYTATFAENEATAMSAILSA
ncbi:hypothetical protein CHUAL_010723 [Chamberlinius hualienensis]